MPHKLPLLPATIALLTLNACHATPLAETASSYAGAISADSPPISAGAAEHALQRRDQTRPDARVRSATPTHAPVNGGLVILPLPDIATLTLPLRHHGQPVWTGQLQAGGQPVAVVGMALQAEGEQTLVDADGQVIARWQAIRHAYPEQRLVLKETRYVTPDETELVRFAREAEMQKLAYRVFSSTAHNDSTPARWPVFRWPLVGRVSSPFGLQRFFNDEPRAPHLGLDIAGPTGAPVVAPADGKVALTGDFFFNGRTVILDHGQGLFSMLCHFSEILVTEGQTVTAGTPVGTVGATGRATGPHLHWTVSLNDARIDPRWLLADPR